MVTAKTALARTLTRRPTGHRQLTEDKLQGAGQNSKVLAIFMLESVGATGVHWDIGFGEGSVLNLNTAGKSTGPNTNKHISKVHHFTYVWGPGNFSSAYASDPGPKKDPL